ncbi:MAG: hypothetical protein R3Y47_05050 [Lachnospiraceae bacterium]
MNIIRNRQQRSKVIKNTMILFFLVSFLGPIISAVVVAFIDNFYEPYDYYAPTYLENYSIEEVTDEDYLSYYNVISTESLYRIALTFKNEGITSNTYISNYFKYETPSSSYNSAYFIESDDIHDKELEISYMVPASQTATIVGYVAISNTATSLTYSYDYEDTYHDVTFELP